ncbi:MAG TPA: hypothetical protein VFK03_01705 [Candidatus Saccharimonadales bacterium]|nr:hypothetical protein [Candidatus Saccharimonadales bacterium]
MKSSTVNKNLILTGIALGISLQAVLWLSNLLAERSILETLVYPLIGIGLIVGVSAYLSRQKLPWLATLFALLFAWPVVKLVYLLPVSWLAFLLQIAVTVASFALAYLIFASWNSRLWSKVSISVVLFVIWFFTVSIVYSYLARHIATTTYIG